jgi:hypothetical protein
MPSKLRFWNRVFIGLAVIMALGLASACSSSAEDADTEEVEHEEDTLEEGALEEGQHEDDTLEEGALEEDTLEEGEHEEGEHEEGSRIPNDGATIHIVDPVDGSAFSVDDDIVIEVEVLGFDLAVEGNHWHVYVDGISYGMVTGGDTDKVLRGLEPGERLVEVYIAGGDHIEFEDGDKITITVE